MSIWPIFLMVNELPYRMRKQRENMLLCGLWFGKSKPFMGTFCDPLHKSLLDLEKGIEIMIGDETIKVQAFLIGLSCDIPARSLILNTNQHNGEYACIKCLQPGKNHRTDQGGNIRVFPYNTDHVTGPPRISDGSISDSQNAVNNKKTCHGIKGPSFLMFTPKFDYVGNVCIDYMHLVLLGI